MICERAHPCGGLFVFEQRSLRAARCCLGAPNIASAHLRLRIYIYVLSLGSLAFQRQEQAVGGADGISSEDTMGR